LEEVDFTQADLTAAIFNDCNLALAVFYQTILEKADFRSAFGYLIDPEENRVKKAKFSLSGIPGLLSKYQLTIQ
jgi:uncharacterized protein YjbI with pentapeptide repeats